MLGGIFHFYSNFKRTFCKQTVAASDLGLHFLPMSHKKDARLIWVKVMDFVFKGILSGAILMIKLELACIKKGVRSNT